MPSTPGYRHMTPAVVDQIVEMRSTHGMSVSAIAKQVGYSAEAVRKRLIVRNVDTARADPITPERQRQMRSLYEAGATCDVIGERYGVTRSSVEYWLRKLGVARRGPSEWLRRYRLDEGAFDTLTPEASYWLGFIYADGCIVDTERKRCVRVELQWRDRGHLERLLRFVGSDMRPYESARRGKRYATIVLNSSHMVATLAGHGIHPRKSERSRRLTEALAESRDFWRGMVDGDGSIMVNPARSSYRMYLLANELEMAQFREYVLRIAPRYRGAPGLRDGILRLNLSGFAAAAVLENLYAGSVQALPRKADIAERIIRHFAGRDPNDRSRIDWPSAAELVARVRAAGFSATGRELGVSPAAVRGHLRKRGAYPLP